MYGTGLGRRRGLGLLLLPLLLGAQQPCGTRCNLVLERSGTMPLALARVMAAREVRVTLGAAGVPEVMTSPTGPRVALAPDGWRWTVSGDYRISQLDARGAVVRQFQRRVQWFRRSTDGSGRAWRVHDFHVDRAGVLWVAMRGFTRERRGEPRTIAELYRREPTYIEAIDLARMRVLGNGTLTGAWIGGFLPDGRVFAVADSPGGGARVDLWRVHVTGASPKVLFAPLH